ncbi:MAG TPA: Hpt domain-containing protein [Bryobacteraceae bacterium]|nr:Hpt domain-containing protein [Bryobacteraceae bacterium]
MSFSAQPPTSVANLGGIIDRAVILDRVGGDEELLREITAIFLEEYPSLIDEIQAAAGAGDAKRLERAAHSLKGSVSNFGAQGPTQAAYKLETMGRRGEMQEVGSAVDDLLYEFGQLRPALEDLAS